MRFILQIFTGFNVGKSHDIITIFLYLQPKTTELVDLWSILSLSPAMGKEFVILAEIPV